MNIFVRDFNNYGYQDEEEKRIITKFGDKLLETYRDFVKKVVSRYLENNAEHEAHNSDVMVASQFKEADMREQFIEILKKLTDSIVEQLILFEQGVPINSEAFVRSVSEFEQQLRKLQSMPFAGDDTFDVQKKVMDSLLEKIKVIPDNTEYEEHFFRICDIFHKHRNYHKLMFEDFGFKGLPIKKEYVEAIPKLYDFVKREDLLTCHQESLERLLTRYTSFEPLMFSDQKGNKVKLNWFIKEIYDIPYWKSLCTFIYSSITKSPENPNQLIGAGSKKVKEQNGYNVTDKEANFIEKIRDCKESKHKVGKVIAG